MTLEYVRKYFKHHHLKLTERIEIDLTFGIDDVVSIDGGRRCSSWRGGASAVVTARTASRTGTAGGVRYAYRSPAPARP